LRHPSMHSSAACHIAPLRICICLSAALARLGLTPARSGRFVRSASQREPGCPSGRRAAVLPSIRRRTRNGPPTPPAGRHGRSALKPVRHRVE
jgi:hypothetical protein